MNLRPINLKFDAEAVNKKIAGIMRESEERMEPVNKTLREGLQRSEEVKATCTTACANLKKLQEEISKACKAE